MGNSGRNEPICVKAMFCSRDTISARISRKPHSTDDTAGYILIGFVRLHSILKLLVLYPALFQIEF